jgi:hypothetical protein
MISNLFEDIPVALAPLTKPGRPPKQPLQVAIITVDPSPTSGLRPAVIAKVDASGINAIAEASPASKFFV